MSTSDDREPWRAYVTTDYGKRCPGCRRPGVSRFLAYERPPTWPDDDEIKITRFCRWCWHETGRDRVYRAAGGRPVEIKLDFYSNSGFPWLTRRHLERGELLPTHFKDPTDPLQWLVFADYYEEKDDKWATLLCKLVGHQVPKFYVDSLGKVTGKNIRFGFRWSWRESGPTGPRTVWQPEDAALLSCQPGMTHRRPPHGIVRTFWGTYLLDAVGDRLGWWYRQKPCEPRDTPWLDGLYDTILANAFNKKGRPK